MLSAWVGIMSLLCLSTYALQWCFSVIAFSPHPLLSYGLFYSSVDILLLFKIGFRVEFRRTEDNGRRGLGRFDLFSLMDYSCQILLLFFFLQYGKKSL